MPSMDIVNEVDMQEADNAVNNAKKVLDNRYDFRGSNTEITLNKKENTLLIATEDEMKLQAVEETLRGAFIKRGIQAKALEFGEPEPASGGALRCTVKLLRGIDKEMAKKIVKRIKDTKLKVQAQIQDEQVRVTGKNIDDLQTVMAELKGADLSIPLQFTNMKR